MIKEDAKNKEQAPKRAFSLLGQDAGPALRNDSIIGVNLNVAETCQ